MDGFEWVVFLFDNYDDRIIEFGFMTLFAAAFPLAPLLAWMANHLELKIDAQLLVGRNEKGHWYRPKSIGRTGLRRPPVMKTEGLGAWDSVMTAMSIVAIMTNAFIVGLLSTISAQAFSLDTGAVCHPLRVACLWEYEILSIRTVVGCACLWDVPVCVRSPCGTECHMASCGSRW